MDTDLRTMSIGKGEILQHGKDVAILAIGATVAPALAAAIELASCGIEATVVNARFAKPLDSELILGIGDQIKCMVTVEENVLIGGFGSGVVDLFQKAGLCDVHVECIGIPDEFVEHGTQEILRAKYRLDAEGIAQTVFSLFPDSKHNSSAGEKNKVKAIPS